VLTCYRCQSEASPRGFCGCADGCTLILGDCREVLPQLEAAAFHSVVTDPPYELGFMGKSWDRSGVAFDPATWEAVRRVAKPGAMLLSFGGTRTFHRLACAIEDAGWELRDTMMWIFGQGFPKALDVSKAIDREAGAEREVVGIRNPCPERSNWSSHGSTAGFGGFLPENLVDGRPVTAPATPEAALWQGWGTALKPAYEPITVAMNRLDGTFAHNAVTHGVAGLNVDGCRIETQDTLTGSGAACLRFGGENARPYQETFEPGGCKQHALGRYPANLIHDGSDEVLAGFPDVDGPWGGTGDKSSCGKTSMFGIGNNPDNERYKGSGSAARFFYCAKASTAERNAGCEGLEAKGHAAYGDFAGTPEHATNTKGAVRNHHPTVKPLALMEYLCRLVSQPKQRGVLLDPFAGSGTTLMAAGRWFARCVGIELDEGHCRIAAARLDGCLL